MLGRRGLDSRGRSSPGGGFTPAMLNGLRLWLRADMGVTLNGSNVSTWADQSGQAQDFVQVTAAKQPAYSTSSLNGRPGVTGDGVDDCLRRATMSYAGVDKITVGMVLKDTTAVLAMIADTGTDDTGEGWAVFVNGTAGKITTRTKSGLNDADVSDTLASPRRLIIEIDRAIVGGVGVSESRVWIDGVEQSVTVTGTGDSAGNFSDALALNLFARNNGGSFPLAGTLGEVAIYNRLLSAVEIVQLDGYMKAFWGL